MYNAKQKSRRTSRLLARSATVVEMEGQRAWLLDADGFLYCVQPEDHKRCVACPLHEGHVVCVMIAEANRTLVSVVEYSQDVLDAVQGEVDISP